MEETIMDPILQILIENLNIRCRFWRRSNIYCRRCKVVLQTRGMVDLQEPYTNCEGRIQDCERTPKELIEDPPL